MQYSGGDESGGAEESPAEVVSEDDQEQSEDEMNEWTGWSLFSIFIPQESEISR